MGTSVGNQHIAGKIRRLRGWPGAWLLVPVALVLGVISLCLAGNLYFSTERAIQANWKLSVPDGLREVEHHEDPGFRGDGYRFTVFDIKNSTQLEGTFFDVRRMSDAELTGDQIGLVSAVTREFQPENGLTVPQPGLRQTERVRYDSTFLCLFDPVSNRFYIYEDIS